IDALIGEADLTGRDRDMLRDAVEGGRLAGAIRADQAVNAPLPDHQVEVGDSVQPTISLAEMPHLKQGQRRHFTPPAVPPISVALLCGHRPCGLNNITATKAMP